MWPIRRHYMYTLRGVTNKHSFKTAPGILQGHIVMLLDNACTCTCMYMYMFLMTSRVLLTGAPTARTPPSTATA